MDKKFLLLSVLIISSLLSNFVILLISTNQTLVFAQIGEGDCDSSYPVVCIPPYPPDLNCDDIPKKNFDVLPPDPHGFDRDEDGIGCES